MGRRRSRQKGDWPHENEGGSRPNSQREEGCPRAITKNKAQNIPLLSAEEQANAHLLGSEARGVGHYAVNGDGREDQGDTAESSG